MKSVVQNQEAHFEKAAKTIDFLKRENLLDKFLLNIFSKVRLEEEVTEGMLHEEIREIENRYYQVLGNRLSGMADGLDCSFTWCETPEGHEFWQSVNQKFMDEEKTTNLCKEFLEKSLTLEQFYHEISFIKKGYASTDTSNAEPSA